MRQYLDRRFLGLGGILAIGLLAFTGIASGTSSAAKPNIYWACVPHNGNIRLVFPGTTCKKGVRLIKWYQSPSAGTNGVSAYAYYYNVGAANVAVGAAVPFDTNGISSPGFTHAVGASAVTLVNAGVYKVSFIVSATEANQMAVFLNLTVVGGGIYGSGAGTQQNSGQVIIQADAGDVLTLRNHTSAAVVGLQAAAGGSAASVNASVSIEKLS
jgi:hypothetical protein